MQALPRPRAVLFDLDDTLTHRRASVARFATRFAQDFASHLHPLGVDALCTVIESVDADGYRPRPEFVALLDRALAWVQMPDENTLLTYWQSVFPQCCVARAGTQRVLYWLRARGIALGLITNGSEAVQQAKIDALAIRSYFATIVISATVHVEKPDPRIFHLALSTLGVAPEEASFVGDHHRNDVWGAAQIGMTSIWLPGSLGWPADVPSPDVQIAALTDVIRLVRVAQDPR